MKTASTITDLGANRAEYAHATVALGDEELTWTQRKLEAIQSTLRRQSRTIPLTRIGDIGCRDGQQARQYALACGATEVHGFEISEAPLALARQNGVIGHVWVSGESPCPVQSDLFDAVIAGDVIEHLFDTDVFLQELHRVLRPGGLLMITTPNLAWWWSRLRLLIGKPPAGIGGASFRHQTDPAIDLKHLRVLPASEWVSLAKRHGFCVERVQGFNYPRLLRVPFYWLDDIFVHLPSLAHSVLLVLRKPAGPHSIS